MQAINHAATALILKRKFPEAPLFGLILATEAVEYLWVGLNLLGVERTILGEDLRSVADVHLVHMPLSHSVATSALIALVACLAIRMHRGRAAISVAVAMALGIFSHVVLDLAVHARDIAIAPFLDGRYGSGLYAELPLLALAVETAWGLACWWLYRGSTRLLCVMLALGVVSIPLYTVAIDVGEAMIGGHSMVFALVILVQMAASSALLWAFARETRPAALRPGRAAA